MSTVYSNVYVDTFKLIYQGYRDKTNDVLFLKTKDIIPVFLFLLEWKRNASKTGVKHSRMDQVQFAEDSL